VDYGISKVLRESNKRVWLIFPIRLGIFSLANYCHVEKDILSIQALKFPTVPNRQFDPDSVVNNFTASQGIRPFVHEAEKFYDMFVQSSSYATVLRRMEEQLTVEEKTSLSNTGILKHPIFH